MGDASAAIDTKRRLTKYDQGDNFGMATAATIYEGTGTAIGSDGKVVHASQAGALYTLGVAQETVVAAAAGDKIKTEQGIFHMANDAGHLLTIANRFGPCYWTDDQTVGSDSSKLAAGVVYDVDATGVWVIMGPMLVTAIASGALLAANNLSDVGTPATAAHNLGVGTADTPVFTGHRDTNVVTKTTTYNVLAADAGGLMVTVTDGEIFNLPDNTAGGVKGMEITIFNNAADGAALVKVEPHAGDHIYGQIVGVEFGSVVSKGIWNTKATQKKGDFAKLRAGATDWYVVGGIGVWASEA